MRKNMEEPGIKAVGFVNESPGAPPQARKCRTISSTIPEQCRDDTPGCATGRHRKDSRYRPGNRFFVFGLVREKNLADLQDTLRPQQENQDQMQDEKDRHKDELQLTRFVPEYHHRCQGTGWTKCCND